MVYLDSSCSVSFSCLGNLYDHTSLILQNTFSIT